MGTYVRNTRTHLKGAVARGEDRRGGDRARDLRAPAGGRARPLPLGLRDSRTHPSGAVQVGRLGSAQRVIKVHLTSTWYSPGGYVRTTYEVGELDLVAVYCGDLDRCYVLPAAPRRTEGDLATL